MAAETSKIIFINLTMSPCDIAPHSTTYLDLFEWQKKLLPHFLLCMTSMHWKLKFYIKSHLCLVSPGQRIHVYQKQSSSTIWIHTIIWLDCLNFVELVAIDPVQMVAIFDFTPIICFIISKKLIGTAPDYFILLLGFKACLSVFSSNSF